MSIHLILGGARSGKSRHAEQLAHASGLPVTVLATAEAQDDEMRLRIARHRDDRPEHWHTVETPLHLADALAQHARQGQCVIVDCLSLWLTNLLIASLPGIGGGGGTEALPPATLCDASSLPRFARERDALLATLPGLRGEVLLVSNEVGLGLVPETPLGRLFRDEAGRLNQAVARCSEQVSFIAAGLPLRLK